MDRVLTTNQNQKMPNKARERPASLYYKAPNPGGTSRQSPLPGGTGGTGQALLGTGTVKIDCWTYKAALHDGVLPHLQPTLTVRRLCGFTDALVISIRTRMKLYKTQDVNFSDRLRFSL